MIGSKIKKAFLFAENLQNIGDLALVLQLAHGLKTHCGIANLTVRQWQLPSSDIIATLAGHNIRVQSGKSVGSLFHRRTLLLYGGGQAVRDNSTVTSMLAVAATMLSSRVGGNVRAALAIGISPLNSAIHARLWRLILSQLSLLTTRDPASFERSKLVVGRNTQTALTADLAFLPSPLHSDISKERSTPAIIIAPCDDLQEGRNLNVAATVAMAAQVSKNTGVRKILLLAHDPRPEMDLAACQKIARAIEASHNYPVEIVASVNIEQYFSAYASAVGVITNRLHSVIFSLLSKAPVFIIGDDNDKLQNVALQYNLPVLPQVEPLDCDTVEIISATLLAPAAPPIEIAANSALENFVLLNKFLQKH